LLRIAECYFLAGDEKLGYDYLAKALIYARNDIAEKTIEL
jgi:hypothetical protein